MPDKELDYALIMEVAKVFGTLSECAAVCKVSLSVIKRHAANDQQFKEAWERGLELCKLDLRRTMFRHSKGFGPQAVTAAIHLSKHLLGMTEKSLVEVTGTIQHEFKEMRASDLLTAGFTGLGLTVAEAGELQDLCDALDTVGSLPALDTRRRERILALLAKGAAANGNIIDGEFTEVQPQLPAPVAPEKSSPEPDIPEIGLADVKNDSDVD